MRYCKASDPSFNTTAHNVVDSARMPIAADAMRNGNANGFPLHRDMRESASGSKRPGAYLDLFL
jgi:hypothetical protein